jgi:hypothetical protein
MIEEWGSDYIMLDAAGIALTSPTVPRTVPRRTHDGARIY